MARANVADASLRAEARWNFAYLRATSALLVDACDTVATVAARIIRDTQMRSSNTKPTLLSAAEQAQDLPPSNRRGMTARWAVPAVLGLFIAILIAASLSIAFDDQDRVITAATNDLDLLASLTTRDIDHRLSQAPAGEALLDAIPKRAATKGQQVLLTDQSGTIVASYPDPHVSGNITDQLGGSPLLTVFADRAGVMRVILPSGGEALATIRALREPMGQIAFVHPMPDVLRSWHASLIRTIVLLACVGGVLSALLAGYLWQAAKTRQADTTCRRMRDRVDMVLSRGRCGLWDWDLARGHIDWSLSMYDIIGMAPRTKALSVDEVDSLIHPEDGGLETLSRVLSQGPGGAVDHIFRIRNAKGDWTWLRAKAELVHTEGATPHLVGIAIDITETMALEERTARADMRLRDAIETISEAFVVWDADNRLVMCNSKFQRFHNLPAEAVAAGTPYAKVMERGTPPIVHSQIPLGGPQPMGARTFEAQLGDGRWLQINERRTKDGGYVSVGTDITMLKHNEEYLIDSERRLMDSVFDLRKSRQILETQKQKLAVLAEKYRDQKAVAENANRAKSDFLANMSHELRTPLNAILGFSEIMMYESYGELGSPLYAEYCKDIHTSGQYLFGVIEDVLEMSRLEAGRVRLEKEDFLVDDALAASVSAIAAMAETNAVSIAIETNPGAGARLVADRSAVEKILGILLNNAVKFTRANGSVTVKAHALGDAVNIHVEDTGVGIAAEALSRLGRPFEQSDNTLKNGMRGSGLGLAIAHSLAELHGGSIQIRSKQGMGTVVIVTLPNKPAVARPQLQLATGGAKAAMRPLRHAHQLAERTNAKISRTA